MAHAEAWLDSTSYADAEKPLALGRRHITAITQVAHIRSVIGEAFKPDPDWPRHMQSGYCQGWINTLAATSEQLRTDA